MEVRPGLLACKERKMVALAVGRVESGWIYDAKVKDRVPGKELRERHRIDDIILILEQNRLRWLGMHCDRKIMIG